MQKIIRVDSKVIVIFEDGCYLEKNNVTEKEFQKIFNAETDEEIFMLMCPQYEKQQREYLDVQNILELVKNSNILILKGDSVYWEEVSQLSLPPELVKAILSAETEENELLLETYKNFWTLMSLNPDERCRQNLFWFLNKWGLKLSRYGFFVGYRNVDFTKEEGVYTDHHSHSFKIKIGEMVTMPREDCDTVQEHTCSRGLHLSNTGWLKQNYYGNQGLVCLCNPADVVCVPPYDSYGKLRTCAYLPIAKAEYDEEGELIPFNADNGFECPFVTQVIYEGLQGTEKDSPYKITIPDVPGIHKDVITDNLLEIALKSITDRQA